MDQGAGAEFEQERGPGQPETSRQGQSTAGWVGTVVHLDTRRDPLTAGFLLRRVTQDQEVEWLVDTGGLHLVAVNAGVGET